LPQQNTYTAPPGVKLVIPSLLANTSCTILGIEGLLDYLNRALGTSYTLEIPSMTSLLEACITKKYDFGTAYGRLRARWFNENWTIIQDTLQKDKTNDRDMRKKALVGGRINDPHINPRRGPNGPWAVSHAWMAIERRQSVWTPINGYKWPIPIPKDADLDRIRNEMLNLGAEYVWLDVLCLRQRGGGSWCRELLRANEWKLDVATIGHVYQGAKVVYNLSGLGRPLGLDAADLHNPRCWFRRAWTLQETSANHIIARDTEDGPLHAEPMDEYQNDILTRFHKQLKSLENLYGPSRSVFDVLGHMQERVAEKDVDKVAGLAFPLDAKAIPVYREQESLEDAWKTLVKVMDKLYRGEMFFLYPKPGAGHRKWRPAWKQVMS
ncbi:hypothetical protein ARMSODRAFT_856044, partial [Armillaria solidipes]